MKMARGSSHSGERMLEAFPRDCDHIETFQTGPKTARHGTARHRDNDEPARYGCTTGCRPTNTNTVDGMCERVHLTKNEYQRQNARNGILPCGKRV
ncbi:hypothetical protein V9T40_014845 [Parthenolecanium corni]|uniref:Uncharacterized protein n=1 Tax=Parthenolecanium corni TaxID=536013 RepID=A0AAN9T6Q5_9HEMI